ncbi:alkyl sulfatase dimerization domain-containing protein [Oceanobacillus kimchii]|uniref:alkyl sulfatase dimerization domain-containing protein n=1 Tax=Oceanobacillus kimchii TaxID=746691 RepID=UPI0009857CA6|nr:alkyl sulfatase dimerization domain-containing protein [Oceanobacillus kimchii]
MKYSSKTELSATGKLNAQGKRFNKRIEKITDNIYSAIGYGLANSILIRTDEGNIIIDTMESLTAAEQVKQEFDRISPQKTAAIIYTHGHTDHVRGASVFMDEETEVYAHAKTKDFFNQQFNQLEPVLTLRGARQFGVKVPKEYIPSNGIGPFLFMDQRKPQMVMPTKEFDTFMDLKVGKVHLQLVAAPGETDDHIFIWLPEEEIVFSADNYYPCFPNLYTIRGTTPRPVFQWIESLDKIRALNASIMVPSHAEPIFGKDRIHELLTVYRDAIQYVHDGVVRGMNEGKTPDELVAEIILPQHMKAYPELQELYGDVAQSVRAIFDGYVGWFDGNATNLNALLPKERAEKYIDLAGGYGCIMTEISKAMSTEEFQWAAELCDMLLAVDSDNPEVIHLKAEALFHLGLTTANANNRSYYLTQSLELKGEINSPVRTKEVQYAFAKKMDMEQFFLKMQLLLDPSKSADKMMIVNLYVTDEARGFQIHIRKGIAEIQSGQSLNKDISVKTTADQWKKIVLGIADPSINFTEGTLTLQGDEHIWKQFIALFHS